MNRMATPAHNRTLRAPLALAFGALLVLIIAATTVTLNTSFSIFHLLAETHETHDEVADALHRLRSDLYLAGILRRDFLLDRSDTNPKAYSDQFAEIQSSANDNLQIIEKALSRQQPIAVQQLRTEVTAYLRPLRQALDWDPVLAPGLRSFLLRAQLKQRSDALQIASEIERLNRDSLRSQQNQIANAERDFRKTLLLISAAAVAIGIVVAGFTIRYTRRLERRSDEAQSELRRLSQHVVKAQEHERKSISRELHDEVGQMLTGLRMELANLDGPGVRQSPADYQRLQEAKRLAERTLQCVRDLSLLLRPSMLDDLGLSPALNWQAKEFSRRSGVPVNLDIRGEVDSVPDEVRTCLYRVVQEALTNVGRHANAHRISISVIRAGERVRLLVEDDGTGFDLSRVRRRGLGLIGLKERVAELDGRVDIASNPGKGTRISIEIPLTHTAVPA